MTTITEPLSAQIEHLQRLYLLLASVPDSRRHDELIERTRLAIATVRKTRATLAARARAGNGPICS
jgi:hypothetical protein